jgi:hypothetical protein
MWRCVSVPIAAVALAVVLVGPIACREADAPATNGGGFVTSDGSCIFYEKHPEASFAIHLTGDWSSSSRSTRNTATNAWQTDVTLTCKGRPDVTVQGSSADPKRLLVNGASFDLSSGSVLRVTPAGEIEQLPFAPVSDIDQPYVKRLGEYFARRAPAAD